MLGFDLALQITMKTILTTGIVMLIAVDCCFLGLVDMEGSTV
jgi:hypothetical protein